MRCGARPCAAQMRCTERRLTPDALAIIRPVQCVVSPGGSDRVRSSTRRTASSGSLGLPGGRVLSRRRPSTPSCMNRSCQRQTAGLDRPEWRMTSMVPHPSAVARMTLARATCFCAALRSRVIASKRQRSSGVTVISTPALIPRAWTAPHPLGIIRMRSAHSHVRRFK